ncbi:MAG: hypothetical protein J6L82_03115 [Alphaproteobacteria bacterium]|nr:hypothetical protein [Alphaproteobacteria bacterium]
MALFNDKKNTAADERTETSQIPLSFTYIAFLIFIFGVCLSCILSVAMTAGRFIEYKVPLFLMEFPLGIICGMGCFLFLAVLAGLVLQKTLNTEESPKSILSRSQKISYFFSLLTTLGFTAYLCAVLVHALKTGQFLSECLYIVFLYACVLGVHFKARKSSLAHMFTTAAFILILVVTAFYGGIAAAKISRQNVTSINGEMFTLVSAQKNNYILVGFDARINRANGKIIILPKQSQMLEQTVFFPFGEQKR